MKTLRSPVGMYGAAAGERIADAWPAAVLAFDAGAPERFELVVHVGAGGHRDLSAYAELAFGHLRLVEGDLGRAAELEAAFSHDGRIAIDSTVISDKDGPCAWYVTSSEERDGTLAPELFERRLPGLKKVAVEDRQAVALGSYLSRVVKADAPAAPRLLILDLPMVDIELLESVGGRMLQQFDRILIRLDHAVDASDVRSPLKRHLAENCFLPTVRVQDGAGRESLLFVLHPNLAAAERLAEALGTLQAEHEKAGQRILDLEDNLAEVRENATALQRQLNEHQELSEVLKTELAEAREQLSRKEAELESCRQSTETATRQAALARAARDELSGLAAASAKDLAALREQVVELSASNQMLREELSKVEAHVELLTVLFGEQGRTQ